MNLIPIHDGILPRKGAIMLFASVWVDLEIIMKLVRRDTDMKCSLIYNININK